MGYCQRNRFSKRRSADGIRTESVRRSYFCAGWLVDIHVRYVGKFSDIWRVSPVKGERKASFRCVTSFLGFV